MQIWVWRSATFASNLSTEHSYVKYGYYELPEGGNVNIRLPKVESDDMDRFTRYSNYILSLAYLPTTCAQSVHTHKWVKKESCLLSEWVIHGLWGDVPPHMQKNFKTYCKQEITDRSTQSQVTDITQVPTAILNISIPVSARFHNVVQWLDYQWCSHGYFLLKNNKEVRFKSAVDYFNVALELYNKVNLMQRLNEAEFLSSDTAVYNMKEFERLINSFRHRPGFVLSPLSGRIYTIRELVFCFDKETHWIRCKKNMLTGAKVKVDSKINFIALPTTYQLFPYVMLYLAYDHIGKRFLLNNLLAPNYNYGIGKAAMETRSQHKAMFQEQLYTDKRIPLLLASSPFWNIGNDGLKWFERKLPNALRLMSKMKRLSTFYDYIDIGLEMFENVRVNEWVNKNIRSRNYGSKKTFLNRMRQLNIHPKKMLFLCTGRTNFELLREIRLCFSYSTYELVSCTPLDDPLYSRIERLRNCRGEFKL
ncbi:hypothetical protein B4U80_12069 [Leptotrombidium deliense]|uniref:Uncharacterized protein n=1 Tax=Leptotrombidium deliense TaxID=299467 RepID=A0A443RYQ4_9ACAR|nr:hypothetical protein B4U80_12069 [Leptotrombidium deliense]